VFKDFIGSNRGFPKLVSGNRGSLRFVYSNKGSPKLAYGVLSKVKRLSKGLFLKASLITALLP
jgi:hypothetical protein